MGSPGQLRALTISTRTLVIKGSVAMALRNGLSLMQPSAHQEQVQQGYMAFQGCCDGCHISLHIIFASAEGL